MPRVPKDKVVVTIYPSIELKQAAVEQAQTEHRSLNGLILTAIEEYLKRRKNK